MAVTVLALVVEDGFIKYRTGGQACIHEFPAVGLCTQCAHLLDNVTVTQIRAPCIECGEAPCQCINKDDDGKLTRPAVTGGANTEWDGKEAVVHPVHYNSHPSGVECWDIAQYYNFNVGTVFKHLWRHGLKATTPEGTLEDLEKAQQYLNKEIQRQSELINKTFTR